MRSSQRWSADKTMNKSEKYIANSIKSWVWSGFYDRDRIHEMIEDIMEDDADETMLRRLIDSELEKRHSEEQNWPEETDCDRLDKVFAMLTQQKIVALQNAGYTTSDGHSDVGQVLSEKPKGYYKGYCFYHGQDLERVVSGDDLYLAFGDLKDTAEGKKLVAAAICSALEQHGFQYEWKGDVTKRIRVLGINWQRRFCSTER
jgi:hypothetical protein